jgi:hypothetical protein
MTTIRALCRGVSALALGAALSGCASGKSAITAPTTPSSSATATETAPNAPTTTPPAESSGFADRCASGDRAGCLTDGDYAAQKGQVETAIRLYERGCELGAARGCADAAKLSDKIGETEKAEKLRDRARTLTNLDR